MWKQVDKNNWDDIINFVEIQKSMGGHYSSLTKKYIKKRLENNDRDWNFFSYDDGENKVGLGFFYHRIRDRIKLAYGSIGEVKDYEKTLDIGCKKIADYLKEKGKNGYAIISSGDLNLKAKKLYTLLAKLGLNRFGLVWKRTAKNIFEVDII